MRMTERTLSINCELAIVHELIGFVWMENGCCKDKPVLITKRIGYDPPLYACECACNNWCTTLLTTVDEAINHYRRMTNREPLYSIEWSESKEYYDHKKKLELRQKESERRRRNGTGGDAPGL